MTLRAALEALKKQDFERARAVIANTDSAAYSVSHYMIKGLCELALQQWNMALETFTAGTERIADHAMLWFNRGIAEENLKMIDAAILSHTQCLAINPAQAEAYGNLSNLFRATRRYADAENAARKALECGASKGDALNCLGLALAKQVKVDEARRAFVEAHKASPNDPDILLNHANLETDVFNFDDAWRLFGAARKIDDKPLVRQNEALARLLAGQIDLGLPLFESRLELPNALRLRPACPRWQGESLNGKKLLIVAEQGFGDVIHFCRYQRELPETELIWAVPNALIRLLSGNLRGAVVDEKAPLPVCDMWIPIMSLPLLTNKKMLGFDKPYLKAVTTSPLPAGDHPRKVGIVWTGARTHLRDDERSIPLPLFDPLFENIKADFYAPFVGDGLDEIGDRRVIRLDHLINDFADTAAYLAQLDCLVTVDTAVAHLAGALGVKTYLLLAKCPDWRWGISGDTTPLYPSITLLRQSDYGDWNYVIEKLMNILRSE